jgi:arylsulfatase
MRGHRIWAAAAILLAACQRAPSIDLVERFPSAEISRERSRIDIGTEDGRASLISGWGADEHGATATFAWGLAGESRLAFFVGTPRPIMLRMRGWPLPYPRLLPPQTVHVVVNGAALGDLALQPDPAEYAVPVPAAALRPGRNDLLLRYGYARRPVDVDAASPDVRTLAVAWDWIALEGLGDADPPIPRHDAGRADLLLPPASEVAFYFDLPPDSMVEFAPAAPDGADTVPAAVHPAFDVSIDAAGQPPQTVRVPASGDRALQRLSLPHGGITRLAFRNASSTGESGGAAVAIVEPRVLLTRPLGEAGGAVSCSAERSLRRAAAHPTIVLYLIDTLRADHLGCYGYGRPTSPRIDAFARQAVRFERALAQAPWTKPAVASIFTGLAPPQHRASGLFAVLGEIPTMASMLAASGYDTAAFVTNGFIGYDFGLGRGFAEHRVFPERPIGPDEGVAAQPSDVMHQRIEVVQRAVLNWLDARQSAAPLFLYVHASDPHAPYLPPPPYRERFAADAPPELGLVSALEQLGTGVRPLDETERQGIEALYDGEVAYADAQFGAFLDELAARGLYDDALIVLIADHGEAFGEHGHLQHGSSLYEPQIAIPLLIKLPGNRSAGTVVRGVAQQIDLLPTVLDVAGVAPPPALPGASLLRAAVCGRPLADRPVYSHLGGDGLAMALESIVIGTRKLVHDEYQPDQALYDLAGDAGEVHDVAAEDPLRTAYMMSLMAAFRTAMAGYTPGPAAELDPAVRERLRALGYAR